MGTRFVAIGGGTGSGKSTLAEAISDRLGAPIIRIDDYYRDQDHLPVPVRRAVNYDAPESVEHTLLTAHLDRLAAGHAVEKPIYDFTRDTRSPLTERVDAAPVVLIEGSSRSAGPRSPHGARRGSSSRPPPRSASAAACAATSRSAAATSARSPRASGAHVAPMHDRWVAPSRALATRIVDGEQPIERLLTLALAEMRTLPAVAAPTLPRLSSVLFA